MQRANLAQRNEVAAIFVSDDPVIPLSEVEPKVKFIRRIVKYLHEIKLELKRSHWPTKREFTVFTGIVLGTVLVIGIFFWGIDNVFLAVLQLIIR